MTQTPFVGSTAPTVTLGRKVIATGLIAAGLYFLWWGIYSAYYGFTWGWDLWRGADYADMIFAFLAGGLVLATGVISLTKR